MLNECKQALIQNKGDIIEIGAGHGHNTIEFLKLAEKYNRKVIVIDPFEEGWSEMPSTYRYPYGIFEDKVKEFKHRLFIHRKNSLCKTSEMTCRATNIAFAYVDGLQWKGAVLNDLRIVSHAHIICVDDMDRDSAESQVQHAVNDYIQQTSKQLTIKGRWALIK